MGKQKILSDGSLSYSPWNRGRMVLPTALCACLAACAGTQAGRYHGPLLPVAGTCDPPGRAALTIDDTLIRFTPHEGVLTLEGRIARDGTIRGEQQIAGADHHPTRHILSAHLNDGRITGTYETPRCRYTLMLQPG